MTENNLIPLYDRVKHQIYDDFERVIRQQTIYLNARSKRKRQMALRFFRSKFVRFYNNIYSTDMYQFIKKPMKVILVDYMKDMATIKNSYDVNTISTVCAAVIRDMKITKISFQGNDEAF